MRFINYFLIQAWSGEEGKSRLWVTKKFNSDLKYKRVKGDSASIMKKNGMTYTPEELKACPEPPVA